MFDYIQISKLNDFIFCPKSIYFHEVYNSFAQGIYHQKPQQNGKLKHENIDSQNYSSSKKYLQSIPIFCDKYGLVGKIDLFDTEQKQLVERKAKIKQIFDGHKYQLYAQYFCLLEMGYEVKSLKIHSLEDNKNYFIDLPDKKETKKFEDLINQIQNYDVFKYQKKFAKKSKCQNCIYKQLCHG
jgi:CRISPR-associated protein Cas4